MKKLVVILIAVLFYGINNAQVSYTSNDLGKIGDIYHTLKVIYDSASWLPAENVDSELWNFSSIIPTTPGIINIQSKDNFEGLEELPASTMVIKNENNNYLCVNLNGDILQLLAVITVMEEELIPFILPQPQDMLHFPLSVGDTENDATSFEIAGTPEEFNQTIPFVDSIKLVASMIFESEVKATGNVITSQNSFAAFKVINSIITKADLYAKPVVGNWFLFQEDVINDSTKNLQFYTPQYGIPVVQVNLTWSYEIRDYHMINIDLQSICPIVSQQTSMYPNPNISKGQLHFSNIINRVTIYDLSGKKKFEIYRTNNKITLPDLSTGVYIVAINGSKQVKKLIINR